MVLGLGCLADEGQQMTQWAAPSSEVVQQIISIRTEPRVGAEITPHMLD